MNICVRDVVDPGRTHIFKNKIYILTDEASTSERA